MCFSLLWIQGLLIWAVVIIALMALIQLVIMPRLPVWLGDGAATLIAAIRILIWAIVAVFVIVIAFRVFSCLLGVR